MEREREVRGREREGGKRGRMGGGEMWCPRFEEAAEVQRGAVSRG
jgi:hypothetical protein